MKRFISLLLTVTMVLSVFTNISAKDLSDIETHWAKEEINELVDLGIINGYPDGTFRPDDSIKVIEYIKIVTLALGEDLEVATKGYWGQPFIDKAFELELIFEGQFDDYDRQITREEMTYIISKALENKTGEEIAFENNIILEIDDSKDISSIYLDSVLKAYTTELITGYPDGRFLPLETATRAEATVVITRLLEYEDPTGTDQEEPTQEYSMDLFQPYIDSQNLDNNFEIIDNRFYLISPYGESSLNYHEPTFANTDYLENIDHLIYSFLSNNLDDSKYTAIEYWKGSEINDYNSQVVMSYAYNYKFNYMGNFYYRFYLQDDFYYNAKEDWNIETLSDSVNIRLNLRRLNEPDGSSDGRVEQYIWNNLKNTLTDMFPVHGEEIAEYVLDRHLNTQPSRDDFNPTWDSKTFGKIQVDFINDSGSKFYFTIN